MHANNLEYFMKEGGITEQMLLHIAISPATVMMQ
jgi:hypothetical protein